MQEGKSQRASSDEFEWSTPAWVESWRPPGYKTREEREFAAYEAERERESLEVLKKSALHKDFMSKLKGKRGKNDFFFVVKKRCKKKWSLNSESNWKKPRKKL